jgi:hypothetical protein
MRDLKWFGRAKPSASSTRPASSVASPKDPLAAAAISSQSNAGSSSDFYGYTSGRWLWNEKEEFAGRYLKFNIPELKRAAAEAIGSTSCVQIEKLDEGSYNKVFLMTMEDGRDVIAKLPNPNAGRPHFSTASEVATMDYVRPLNEHLSFILL